MTILQGLEQTRKGMFPVSSYKLPMSSPEVTASHFARLVEWFGKNMAFCRVP
jgi:hypothetical protein